MRNFQSIMINRDTPSEKSLISTREKDVRISFRETPTVKISILENDSLNEAKQEQKSKMNLK